MRTASDAPAEDVGEAGPPRGVERHHVGPLARREALDQLDHRGHAVHGGAREGQIVVAAEAQAVDARARPERYGMAPASPTSTRRGAGRARGEARARPRPAGRAMLAGGRAQSGRSGAGRRARAAIAAPAAPAAARRPSAPAAGSVGAQRGRGEEHEQRGRRIAEVLEARGGVERRRAATEAAAPSSSGSGEPPAPAVEHRGHAEQRHHPRGARPAERRLEGLRAERREVLDGLERHLQRRDVRVRRRRACAPRRPRPTRR